MILNAEAVQRLRQYYGGPPEPSKTLDEPFSARFLFRYDMLFHHYLCESIVGLREKGSHSPK